MTNKLLKILFFFLVIILLIEILYIYGSSKLEKNSTNKKFDDIEPVKIITEKIVENPAIKNNTLERWYTSLRWYTDDVLYESIITNRFSGTISRINKQGRVFEGGGEGSDGIRYSKSLTIKGSKGNENWFFFTKESLQLTKVFEQDSSGRQKPIDFDALEIGDNVKMEGSISLTEEFESSNIYFTIIKII